MPSIPEEKALDGLDEFVDWDAAAPPVGESGHFGDPSHDAGNDTGHDAGHDAGHNAADTGFAVNGTVSLPSKETDRDPLSGSIPVQTRDTLLFENPDADIFSLMALEHYDQSMMADAWNAPNLSFKASEDLEFTTMGLVPSGAIGAEGESASFPNDLCPAELWDVPGEPCTSCELGGFQCKTISEGFYKGYCTSCVALRRACSFGLAAPGPLPTNESFPPNPWPTIGDHPDPILAAIENDGTALTGTQPSASGPANLLSDLAEVSHQTDLPSADQAPAAAPPKPKLGTRFSRESARILKNWVVTHSRHPYPTEEENESLQRMTGLTKTQISNWLANARRRGKIPSTRSTSPHVRSSYASVGPMEAPQPPRRSGTPSPFDRRLQEMDNLLLKRWAYSPPENEPASATDIVRNIKSGVTSGLDSPSSYNFTDDGSGRSLFNDSTNSSLGTSHSSGTGSFASAFSHGSRGSFGSAFSSLGRGRRRRRRHSAPRTGGDPRRASSEALKASALAKRTSGPTPLIAPLRTYQCTFCTETFKTKHDWQRHEKSLHLSLERWICSPQGPVSMHPESRLPSCVFCGVANPDVAHIESHNFAACQERSKSDRTFYRKDHLRQHLRLVHGVKFASWAMDSWKVATPEIRSRCGFCGVALDTWSIRVDHLAEHFKVGNTMADWKGDWGFDEPVLKLVENSIPPYLIHHERNTPLPFSAGKMPSSSPRNVYELLRDELQYWLQNQNHVPGTELGPEQEQAMRLEACRIVFAVDGSCKDTPSEACPSWLRDLVLGDPGCTQRARLSPLRTQKESLLDSMAINGKRTAFEACPLEAALHDYARERALVGTPVTDTELQTEACRILQKMESGVLDARNENTTMAESTVVGFLIRMALQSTTWLTDFHSRAQIPRLVASGDGSGSIPVTFTDSEPSHSSSGGPSPAHGLIKPSKLFVSDTNCYRRLAQELARFVSTTMSPNNPNAHIPTDEEIQQQARCILYDDDDPWNQTAADNAEWLMRFKRDVGILPGDDGPGLPAYELAWNVAQGGSGFAPPYCFPQSPIAPLECPNAVVGVGCSGATIAAGGSEGSGSGPPASVGLCSTATTTIAPDMANKYIQSFTSRYAKPARVFCSRELETGLTEYVRAAVAERGEPFPTDDALRAKGREILGCSPPRGTSFDSDDLLGKFKEMVRAELAQEQKQKHQKQQQMAALQQQPLPFAGAAGDMGSDLNSLGLDMNLDSLTQEDMDSLMQDMVFHF